MPLGASAFELGRLVSAAHSVVAAELSRRTGKSVGPALLRDRLAESVRELNAQLTTDKGRRANGYLNDPRLQLAYLAHHLPMHAAKTSVLIREVAPARPAAETVCILDVGAGPLSASLGALMAWPGKAEIHGVDRATGMMRMGQDVLGKLAPEARAVLHAASVREVPALARKVKPHLVVAANVIGELAREERAEFLVKTWDALPEGSHFLVMEPGTRVHGQGLVEAREALRAAREVHIAAPCIGHPRCPLLGSKDWCHADRLAQWPHEYLDVARRAGLAPQELKFSYLWLTRKPAEKTPSPLLRLIGGPMSPRPGVTLRYACGAQGRVTLEGGSGSPWTDCPGSAGGCHRNQRAQRGAEQNGSPRAPAEPSASTAG